MNLKRRRFSWFVYLVRCSDRSLYTGIARDVRRRVREHNRGFGSKFARSRRPVRLVYSEGLPTRSAALQREHEIKCWTRPQKLALIEVKRRGIMKKNAPIATLAVVLSTVFLSSIFAATNFA